MTKLSAENRKLEKTKQPFSKEKIHIFRTLWLDVDSVKDRNRKLNDNPEELPKL